jgi:hypothetical protein
MVLQRKLSEQRKVTAQLKAERFIPHHHPTLTSSTGGAERRQRAQRGQRGQRGQEKEGSIEGTHRQQDRQQQRG